MYAATPGLPRTPIHEVSMRIAILLLGLLAATAAQAETVEVVPQAIPVWKSVYGQVQARDTIPARARTGGTIVALEVTEGDRVAEGQRLGTVEDDKLQFQIDSLDAQARALEAQLATAQSDLTRGESLRERGVITAQRLEQLQAAADVIRNNIANIQSQRLVIEQQIAEGEVLAPESGIVVSVPVSRGSVLTPGETLAQIAGGGTFLRLNIPERHAADLAEGDTLAIAAASGPQEGRLVKLYPLIQGGRLQADVEVDGLDARFIGRRVPVRLPVGSRDALLVPRDALIRSGGLDFVRVEGPDGPLDRTVVPGETLDRDGTQWIEILTGLEPGDRVVTGDD